MRLQFALDQIELDEALSIIEELRDVVDICEIGTPFIIKEGLKAAQIIKKNILGISLMVDVRIVDGVRYESKITFEAGAYLVTVLGVADIPRRPDKVEKLGAEYICVHTASDLKGLGKNNWRRYCPDNDPPPIVYWKVR